MQFSRFLAAALLFATACASDSAPTGRGSSTGESTGPLGASSESSGSAGSISGAPQPTTEGEGTDAGADTSSSSGGAATQPIELDRGWVEGLEGAWLGPVSGTPLGDLPQFYWEFAWTKDDVLLGVADSGMGFRFEFEFAQHDGQWTLLETGTLPGDMTQSYELHPVARDGDLVRFEVLDQPGYLRVDILPGEGSFEMAVFVHGEAHGTFDLAHPS
ncbi:MAG: hypothetical protein KUG77_22045 [Nannocystaceae bacterium]|nr:hypothetical protein [Nannocystaceae bacterium]